jgi:hypothetical protein
MSNAVLILGLQMLPGIIALLTSHNFVIVSV